MINYNSFSAKFIMLHHPERTLVNIHTHTHTDNYLLIFFIRAEGIQGILLMLYLSYI